VSTIAKLNQVSRKDSSIPRYVIQGLPDFWFSLRWVFHAISLIIKERWALRWKSMVNLVS